jgi:hypothetical protein
MRTGWRIAAISLATSAIATVAEADDSRPWPNVVNACPHAFSNVHQVLPCLNGILTDDPLHLALENEVVPGDGSVGIVLADQWIPPGNLSQEYNLSGAAMLSGFWAVRASAELRWPTSVSDEERRLTFFSSLRDMPQLDYFGIGPLTPLVTALFAANEFQGGVRTSLPVADWATVTGGVQFDRWRLRGVDNAASVERNYTEETAPGINRQPDEIEYRIGIVLQKHAGSLDGKLSVQDSLYEDISGQRRSFQRLDLTLEGGVSLRAQGLNVGRLLARVTVNAVHARRDPVPFYYLPSLGGSDIDGNETLRGFANYRFRGQDAALGQIEYDHIVFDQEWLHGLLLYDVGQVATSSQQLRRFGDLRHDYGIGTKIVLGNKRDGLLKAYAAFGGGEGVHFAVHLAYPY